MAQNFIPINGQVSGATLAPKLRQYIDALRDLTQLGAELGAEISQINGDIANNSLPDAMKTATGLATADLAANVTNTIAAAHNDIVSSGAVLQCLSRFG